MRRVLIVSPHFPPVSTPDMHRVRMSLPYFREFGWEPEVLAVEPEFVDAVREPELETALPPGIPVWRTHAVPQGWTRRAGFSDLGLRALPFLYRRGAELLSSGRFDLVYFSSTLVFSFTLGRLWRRRFGVPYVVDLQDPWVSGYYDGKPAAERPPKYWLVSRLHRVLERWTLARAGGLVAVSQDYIEDLRRRLPGLGNPVCRTIPFGGSARDIEQAAGLPAEAASAPRPPGEIHGVYAGVLGVTMRHSCEIICRALADGLRHSPELFGRVRLRFAGTDYANRRHTLLPIAERSGVAALIHEEPRRVSYFQVLRMLRDADFLIVPGTDDPGYTASKIYPYILSRKPMLAVFHQRSGVVDLLRRTHAGDVVTFASGGRAEDTAAELERRWSMLLAQLPFQPDVRWDEFAPFTAPETTRRQCELFDAVVAAG